MKTAYLFPGQGSQFVGMGKEFYDNTEIGKKYYEEADDLLGFSLSKISFNGPDEILKHTQYTQPSIYVHSSILSHILLENGENPDAVAGHSLGELSAMVCAGVFTFEDGLKIVKVRSQEMAKAGESQPGMMVVILGADDSQIAEICNQDGIVVPANENAPGQIVISGEVNAVQNAIETAKSLGIRRALSLNVSGAFHSPLMSLARKPLLNVLDSVKFNTATAPVYQNVNGNPETDSSILKSNLLNQLENPVHWADTIRNMINDGIDQFIEVGPGKILQGLNRRINKDTVNFGISNLKDIQSFEV